MRQLEGDRVGEASEHGNSGLNTSILDKKASDEVAIFGKEKSSLLHVGMQ